MTSPFAEEAFHWIVGILNRRKIPFQITGGLAARVYGSTRPLNDIDIDVPDARLPEIASDVEQYIEYGPAHFADERWDLQLLVLNYKGQLIDICGGNQLKICDARDNAWKDSPTDFSASEMHEVFGLEVPVVDRTFLVGYKLMLQGKHQTEDVSAVRKSMQAA